MNLAHATIIGRLTIDPSVDYIESKGESKTFVKIQLAVNSKTKNEEVSYFHVEAWGKQAQIISEYCVKGTELLVQGELKQDRWTNKEGMKRDKIKLVANYIQLGSKYIQLGSKKETKPIEDEVEDNDPF